MLSTTACQLQKELLEIKKQMLRLELMDKKMLARFAVTNCEF